MRLGRFLSSLLIYINLINISLSRSCKHKIFLMHLSNKLCRTRCPTLHRDTYGEQHRSDQQVLLKCLYYTFYLFLVITLKALFIFPCKMHTNIYIHVKTYIYTFRIVVLVFLVLDLESTLYL